MKSPNSYHEVTIINKKAVILGPKLYTLNYVRIYC
jgi:hypothetical protein